MRYALDILSILTVVPKTQLLLSEAVAVVDEGGSSVSTIGWCCYRTLVKCCRALITSSQNVCFMEQCAIAVLPKSLPLLFPSLFAF